VPGTPWLSRGGVTTEAALVTPGTVIVRGPKALASPSQDGDGEGEGAAEEGAAEEGAAEEGLGDVVAAGSTCPVAVRVRSALGRPPSSPGCPSHTEPATITATATATATAAATPRFTGGSTL